MSVPAVNSRLCSIYRMHWHIHPTSPAAGQLRKSDDIEIEVNWDLYNLHYNARKLIFEVKLGRGLLIYGWVTAWNDTSETVFTNLRTDVAPSRNVVSIWKFTLLQDFAKIYTWLKSHLNTWSNGWETAVQRSTKLLDFFLIFLLTLKFFLLNWRLGVPVSPWLRDLFSFRGTYHVMPRLQPCFVIYYGFYLSNIQGDVAQW